MKRFGIVIAFVAAISWAVLLPASAGAQDEDKEGQPAGTEEPAKTPEPPAIKPKINNLPQNFKGLTGLFRTASPRVLELGSFEVGPAWVMEQCKTPSYTRTTYAFNAGVGVGGHVELALHVPYVETDLFTEKFTNNLGVLEHRFSSKSQAGIGSTELHLKWAVSQQKLFLPALALGFGFVAPGDSYSQGISQVKYWGLRSFLSMGIEINDLFFTDYAMAVIADGGVTMQDLGSPNRKYEEKHGEVHAGMVFPLHPRNWLTLLLEYEGLIMKGTTNEQNENGFLGGLRFTSPHIAATVGAEFVLVSQRDMEDRIRYVANLSYKFGPPYPLFP